ncbi:MAG: hypothetical protein E7295_10115 [Lachnospiraceae bacterium]|nr:hypothetical protein [Lachnospiraceae bacterium]
MARLLRFLTGFLQLRVWGFSAERFLNLCAKKGIPLWNMESMEDGMRFCMPLKDFWDLRPLVRKTGVRVAIQKKNGLPFFVKRFRKRWIFFAGVVLTIFLLLWCSQRLWGIEIRGNVMVTDDQIMDFMETQKVHVGISLSDIQVTELEKALRREYEDVIWTSIRIVGTDLMVDIKERDVPEPSVTKVDLNGMDMISPFDGVVVEAIVRSGVPKVKVGELVTKDQILVEARVPTYLEDGTIREWLTVTADADIWLEHQRYLEDSFSLYYVENQLTGREKTRYVLQFGNSTWSLDFQKNYYWEDVVETDEMPSFLQALELPIKFRKILHREGSKILRKLDEDGIKRVADEKIFDFLATLEEKGVQIIEKDVKISIEGDFCLIHGEILTREKVRLYRKTEEEFDKTGSKTTGE